MPGAARINNVHRLWNDSENAVDDSLLGMAKTHSGLVILDGCRAILRRDFETQKGKVKLISGGGAGNEPTHAGFVGPGMLTAAVSGNIYTSPSSDSIYKVIQKLSKNDKSSGVLLLVQNYTGYRINFAIAKSRAERNGIDIKMLLIRDDASLKCFKKTAGKRGLVGSLFIYKIAGAMAEAGMCLDRIYGTCNRIIDSAEISTIGFHVGIPNTVSAWSSEPEIEYGSGIHGEAGMSREPLKSPNEIIDSILEVLLAGSTESDDMDGMMDDVYFPLGDKVAVIINNLGGCSQLEANIIAKEVIQQLTNRGITVARIYTGSLMTSLDTNGFHISLLNVSKYPEFMYYLDAPTLAPMWPKMLTITENDLCADIGAITNYVYLDEDDDDNLSDYRGPLFNSDAEKEVFFTSISYACTALIACSKQIDIMDLDSGDGDCGTTIARGAKAIHEAILSKEISDLKPSIAFFQISRVAEQTMGGIQGGMYSLFFETMAKEFSKSSKICTDVELWVDAFTAAVMAMEEVGEAKAGDRSMLDSLLVAQCTLRQEVRDSCHPIAALGAAVKAAEERAIRTLSMKACVGRASLVKCKPLTQPDPGAHAVGIWMRAAYEAIKLKLICECENTN